MDNSLSLVPSSPRNVQDPSPYRLSSRINWMNIPVSTELISFLSIRHKAEMLLNAKHDEWNLLKTEILKMEKELNDGNMLMVSLNQSLNSKVDETQLERSFSGVSQELQKIRSKISNGGFHQKIIFLKSSFLKIVQAINALDGNVEKFNRLIAQRESTVEMMLDSSSSKAGQVVAHLEFIQEEVRCIEETRRNLVLNELSVKSKILASLWKEMEETANKFSSELSNETMQLTEEESRFKSIIDSKTEEIGNFKKKLMNVEGQNILSDRENDEMKVLIKRLEDDLEMKMEEVKNLERELDSFNGRKESLDVEGYEITADSDYLKREAERLKIKIGTLEERIRIDQEMFDKHQGDLEREISTIVNEVAMSKDMAEDDTLHSMKVIEESLENQISSLEENFLLQKKSHEEEKEKLDDSLIGKLFIMEKMEMDLEETEKEVLSLPTELMKEETLLNEIEKDISSLGEEILLEKKKIRENSNREKKPAENQKQKLEEDIAKTQEEKKYLQQEIEFFFRAAQELKEHIDYWEKKREWKKSLVKVRRRLFTGPTTRSLHRSTQPSEKEQMKKVIEESLKDVQGREVSTHPKRGNKMSSTPRTSLENIRRTLSQTDQRLKLRPTTRPRSSSSNT